MGQSNSWAQDYPPPTPVEALLDELDAEALGVEFRWVGDQSDDCAAALDPSQFHQRGANEWARFKAGAAQRGEVAVAIMTITATSGPRSVNASAHGSVFVGGDTSVTGDRIGHGTLPSLADSLNDADRDLANRLLAALGVSGDWLALSLSGSEEHTSRGVFMHEPEGELVPLLVSRVGEPVAAVWLSPDGKERTYVLPQGHSWKQTLTWLLEKCLPAHAPSLLKELRRDLLPVSEADISTRERSANKVLGRLEEKYAKEHKEAAAAAEEARARADAIRDPLLYETSKPLEQAVKQVLLDAGLAVIDIDERFGEPISADLLVRCGEARVLVEVKSSQSPAPENLMDKLVKHMATWPNITKDEPLHAGVLVVSHELRLQPSERSPQPYSRKEFVAALPHRVVTTIELLNWWRSEDWDAIRASFCPDTNGDSVSPSPQFESSGRERRRPWRGRTQD